MKQQFCFSHLQLYYTLNVKADVAKSRILRHIIMDNTSLGEILAISAMLVLAALCVALSGSVFAAQTDAEDCPHAQTTPAGLPILVPSKGSPHDRSLIKFFNPELLTPRSQTCNINDIQSRTSTVLQRSELFSQWRVRW